MVFLPWTTVPRELCEEKLADFLVLNHADHATTMYRNVFRVPPAHVLHVKSDGSVKQHRYWSPADIKPVRLSSDAAYADGLRECLELAVRRQMRSVHPVGCLLSGGLDSSSVSILAARALTERNQRLVAFTGVPRHDFDGAVPDGCYADETPYVDAIQKQAGNIDVEYVRNDECDDFAQLERFFIALDGPVRNPTNFGWMMAILQRARTKGRRVLLSGLYGNYTISWNGWSQTVGHLLHGRLLLAYRQWQLYYRSTSYSRWVALRKLFVEPVIPGGWAIGRIAAATQPGSRHGKITPQFAPISRLRWTLVPAPKKSGMISSIVCGQTNARRGWLRSIMLATGTRRRKPLPVSKCAIRPPTWTWFATASAFRPNNTLPKASIAH